MKDSKPTLEFFNEIQLINEISPQSILASIIGFTVNGLVFVRILDSSHKPFYCLVSIHFYFSTFGFTLASYYQKPNVKGWKPTLEFFNEIQL